ncbi:Acyl carrier protein [Serratia plymuthica]|nr:Acyl carrier protein [Serratia plymuthica]VEI19999.1 Acyl carrier protein [Serratia plymuthica]
MDDVESRIKAVIAEQLGVPISDVLSSQTLQSLGADSLDNVEIFMSLEENLGVTISEEQAEKLVTISQIVIFFDEILKNYL